MWHFSVMQLRYPAEKTLLFFLVLAQVVLFRLRAAIFAQLHFYETIDTVHRSP